MKTQTVDSWMLRWYRSVIVALTAASLFVTPASSQDVEKAVAAVPAAKKGPVSLSASSRVPLGRWVLIQLASDGDSKSLVRVYHLEAGQDREVTSTDDMENLLLVSPGRYAFTFPLKGNYRVEAVVVKGDEFHVASAPFVIGDGDADIVPPGDALFNSPDGLSVLIIEETGDRAALSKGQQEIILGKKARDWLDDNTVSDGEFVGWRIWDDDFSDEELEETNKMWVQAYTAAKEQSLGKLPWMVAANKGKGYSGPLPDSVDALIEILGELK